MRITHEADRALALIRTKAPILVYDLETTGLSKKTSNIIQFSGDLYSCAETGNYEKEASLNLYIKQDEPLPAKITELTGITDAQLETEGVQESVAAVMIWNFFQRAKIISGYNNQKFDDAFIDRLFQKHYGTAFCPENEIDVFQVAKELIDIEDLCEPHYKLCNVADYYKVTQEGFHNAAVDIDNTWRVLKSEMRDLVIQKKERKTAGKAEGKEENFISDFEVRSIRRWKRSRTLDRLYIDTTEGSAWYDYYRNEVHSDRHLDPELLLKKAGILAGSMGFSSLQSVS